MNGICFLLHEKKQESVSELSILAYTFLMEIATDAADDRPAAGN